MKKLLIISVLLVSTLAGLAQFPSTQYLGTVTTLVKARGGLQADSGFIVGNFTDTTQANNNPYIKNIAGIIIRVGNDLYMRNITVNAWIQLFTTFNVPTWQATLLAPGGSTLTEAANIVDVGGHVFAMLNASDINFLTTGTSASMSFAHDNGGLSVTQAGTTNNAFLFTGINDHTGAYSEIVLRAINGSLGLITINPYLGLIYIDTVQSVSGVNEILGRSSNDGAGQLSRIAIGYGLSLSSATLRVDTSTVFGVQTWQRVMTAGNTWSGNVIQTSPNTTGVTTASAYSMSLNAMTTGTGLYMPSSTCTACKVIDIVITGTAGIDNQTGLSINLSGTNSAGAQTTYGARIVNAHAGTSTNVGLELNVSGGSTNTALRVPSGGGRVAIGQNTANAALDVLGSAIIDAISTSSSAGNGNLLTGNATNSTGTVTAAYLYLGGTSAGFRLGLNGNANTQITASGTYATISIAASAISENSTGTHPGIFSFATKAPTVTGNTATVTNAGNVYIEGPAIGVTSTNPRTALWVDAGTSQFDDTVLINAVTPVERFTMNGNISLTTAGNKIFVATGSNASIGVSGAMTAGTITISTTAVTASSKIFLTHATTAGVTGVLTVGTIVAGTSFVINSSNAADTGTVNWWIIN